MVKLLKKYERRYFNDKHAKNVTESSMYNKKYLAFCQNKTVESLKYETFTQQRKAILKGQTTSQQALTENLFSMYKKEQQEVPSYTTFQTIPNFEEVLDETCINEITPTEQFGVTTPNKLFHTKSLIQKTPV